MNTSFIHRIVSLLRPLRRVARFALAAGTLIGLTALSTQGATRTWTGAGGDGAYATATNWLGGVAPANNSWQDTARFETGATAVSVPSGHRVSGLQFAAAGWTLATGSFADVNVLSSAGTGTNTLNVGLSAYGNATWTVGGGNTLVLGGSFYQRNKNITLTGGGTLEVNSAIGGYSGAAGSWGIHIANGKVRMNTGAPYQAGTGGAIFISGPDATIELQTTIAGAGNLISANRIIDEWGDGLAIEDAGGGFTRVMVYEPPAGSILWKGTAGDGLFATAGNWLGGVAPANNAWQHTAVFNVGATAITTPSARQIKGLNFLTAGWTLGSGSFSELTTLSSAGSGTNTLNVGVTAYANATWSVGSGNTLVLGGSFYQRNKNITLTGGGVLQVNSAIGGYSGAAGSWGIHIVDGRVVMGTANPYQSGTGGALFINGMGAALELPTTMTGAQNLIAANRIVDELGNGLIIEDLGGNGVQVVAAGTWLAAPPIAGDWQLEFEDYFDGAFMDGTRWRLGQHWPGIGGSANVAPENVTVSDGKLRIKMEQRQVSYGGSTKSYATGEVSTFVNFRQKHGYFEARIKYPAVTGLWPAFWLMPDRADYGWKDGYYRSLLKFDLTGVDPGAINTAELRMKVSSMDTGGSNNVVFMALRDDSWTESTLTWNNAPVPDPVWIAQRWNQAVVGQDMTVDVKNFVAEQMAGDKKISFVVADTYMKTKAVRFHSREAATQADRPRLVINGVTYYASEDAYARWGTLADNNYGSTAELVARDSWGDTATTFNGGMEVDIMESLGIWGPNETQHAVHWDGYEGSHQSLGWPDITYPATSDGFHVFGMYWEEGLLEFYVDGVKTAEWANSRVMSVPAYLILSLQAGGWDGNNPGTQVHNQVMEVDWVRAWSGTKSP